MNYEIAGVQLDQTPLVNAAGSVNGTNSEQILREVEELARTPIGAITVGSFTLLPAAGNEAAYGGPVYYYDTETELTYNSMGLPNIGIAAARQLMPQIINIAHHNNKPVIASVSPAAVTAETGSTHEQAASLVYDMATTGVDLIEVNASCPNVVVDGGGRKPIVGYDIQAMKTLIYTLDEFRHDFSTKIGLKLPPYRSREELAVAYEIAKVLTAESQLGYIATANTIPNQRPESANGEAILSVPNGLGGMSGPATHEVGREQLRLWRQLVGGSIDIVSQLGVSTGQELQERLGLGASAAAGVTFLWENKQGYGTAVNKLIEEWVEASSASAK